MFRLLLLVAPVLCGINTNYYTSGCVCDITTECDYLCCCDTSCVNSTTVLSWKKNNQCYPANSNGLAINLCSNTKAAQVTDLHSGLRMIYEIIKRLLCIQTINFNASTSAYNTFVSQSAASDTISKYVNSHSTTGYSNPYSSVIQKATFNGNPLNLPIPLGNSYCGWNQAYVGVDIPRQKCKSVLSSSLPDTLKIQTYGTTYTKSVYDQNGALLSNSLTTTTPSTSSPWSVDNLVVQALVQVTWNSGDSSISKVEVQLVVANISGYVPNVYSQVIEVRWKSSNDSYYRRTGNVGYTYGSSLIVIDNNNILTQTPMRMAFADASGNCVANSAKGDLWDIKFGQDFAVFCNGNASTVMGNINNAFKMLGAIGAANSSNSLDFVNVTGSLTAGGILSIYYSRIGESGNSQFQIKSATLTDQASTGSSSIIFSFFVEFKQIPSSAVLYTPPPPTVQVRLPNDVLYPFHIY